MDTPGLFSHGDDASAGVVCRGEVDVAHFSERVSNGVVDGALADLATLDVGDGDTQGKGDGGGREHLVAVGDEQEEVGAQISEQVGKAEHGDADGLGHSDVGVGAEKAFDAPGDGEAVMFDLLHGRTEGRGEMRAHGDELEVDCRMRGQVVQRPIEMAVIGAGAGDYGNLALHHHDSSVLNWWRLVFYNDQRKCHIFLVDATRICPPRKRGLSKSAESIDALPFLS